MLRRFFSWRLAFLASAATLVILLAADLSRPASAQHTARLAIAGVRWYQRTLSGHVGVRCRFRPTCSQYAIEVLRKHGLAGGSWRAAKRLARCGPWTPRGTVDLPD